MDLLYQEIRKNIVDRRRSLVYAPYIQAFIEHATKQYYSAGPGGKRNGIYKPALDKPIKGVTKKDLEGKHTRDFDSMEIPGSTSYESKRRQLRIIRGLRTWYCIYMEERERRHKDRARLKQNNQLLKALIRHHNIDMPADQGSKEEWSDLGEEGDVFGTDDDSGSAFSTEEEEF